jgi:hypothetical protein
VEGRGDCSKILTARKSKPMLITIIVLQSLVNVLRERRQNRRARRSLRELTDIGSADAEQVRASATPFWRAVLVRSRKDVSVSKHKRARSRKAMRRLSRISERKMARH